METTVTPEVCRAAATAVKRVLDEGYRTPDLARGDQSARVLSTTEVGNKVREFLVGAAASR